MAPRKIRRRTPESIILAPHEVEGMRVRGRQVRRLRGSSGGKVGVGPEVQRGGVQLGGVGKGIRVRATTIRCSHAERWGGRRVCQGRGRQWF